MKTICVLILAVFTVSYNIVLCEDICAKAEHIIDVSSTFKKNNMSTCSSSSGKRRQCIDIESALNGYLLNNTCIFIHDNQVLSNSIVKENVDNLVITNLKQNSNINITCNNTNATSGIQFINSSNITLKNLSFYKCGSKEFFKPMEATGSHLSTVLNFRQVKHINIIRTWFENSIGYGVIMNDVVGNITLRYVTITKGTNRVYHNATHYQQFVSSGGLYIDYTKDALPEYSSDAEIKIQFCNFVYNREEMFVPNNVNKPRTSLSCGGGLKVVFSTCLSSQIVLSLDRANISYNFADNGGGICLHYTNKESNILFKNVTIQGNTARYNGGGFILANTNQYKSEIGNTSFYSCHFARNSAKVGGAYHQKLLNNANQVLFKDCSFNGNMATVASGVYLYKSNLKFVNVEWLNNGFINHLHKGTLYAVTSVLNFYGGNTVSSNKNTAFILDNSSLKVNERLIFLNNSGSNGGALSLYGHSKIYLFDQTSLKFKNNSATRRGGAIYVNLEGPLILAERKMSFKIHNCFFLFQNNNNNKILKNWKFFKGSVSFINNTANLDGKAIFATTLQYCRDSNYNHIQTLTGWTNFCFYPNISKSIATYAINISYNRNDWKTILPGKLLSSNIYLYDERNNTVTQSVDLYIVSNTDHRIILRSITIEGNKRFIVSKNQIKLVFTGEQFKDFSIIINTTYGFTTPTIISNLSLKACYFGFTHISTSGKCICALQKNKGKGIAQCVGDQSEIYLFKGRWADPYQTDIKYDKEITHICPEGYCKECNTSVSDLYCLFKPKITRQCAKNRNQSSRLCSRCNDGLSVGIGAESCINCNGSGGYNYWWFVPVLIIGISAVVILVLWLNVDIYSNYLNSSLYFYQVVSLLFTSNLDVKKPIRALIGIISMGSSGGLIKDLCLWNNLNDLKKNAFNYFLPGWMIAFLFVFAIYINPNSFFSKQNCLRAFTIVSVYAYSDFTRITFNFFKSVTINQKTYVWIYANVGWNSSEHQPYEAVAFIVFIVIVLGFPLILLTSSKIMAVQIPFINNPIARWIPIFDSFQYCFKDNNRWFASYYFICRALLLAINAGLETGPLQNVIMVLLCLFICMFFAVISPYKVNTMNIFDILVLGNLTAIGILILVTRSAYSSEDKQNCGIVINVLICLPLLFVVSRLMYMYLPKLFGYLTSFYLQHGQRIAFPKRLYQEIKDTCDVDYVEYKTDDDDDHVNDEGRVRITATSSDL